MKGLDGEINKVRRVKFHLVASARGISIGLHCASYCVKEFSLGAVLLSLPLVLGNVKYSLRILASRYVRALDFKCFTRPNRIKRSAAL